MEQTFYCSTVIHCINPGIWVRPLGHGSTTFTPTTFTPTTITPAQSPRAEGVRYLLLLYKHSWKSGFFSISFFFISGRSIDLTVVGGSEWKDFVLSKSLLVIYIICKLEMPSNMEVTEFVHYIALLLIYLFVSMRQTAPFPLFTCNYTSQQDGFEPNNTTTEL